jgi:hypothetical protein
MGDQNQWHHCQLCQNMYYGLGHAPGHAPAGVCVDDVFGGTHSAQGFEFNLPFVDGPEAPFTQANWFFCRKCACMFFVTPGGDAGTCAADGGPHDSTGSFNFHLPHDVPEGSTPAGFTQANWRFCRKCHVLFFGGNPGQCKLGGGHDPNGSFNFVLPHGEQFSPESYTL